MRELTIYIVESLEPIITSYLESHLKFLFKIFFLMWTIFKVFRELVVLCPMSESPSGKREGF